MSVSVLSNVQKLPLIPLQSYTELYLLMKKVAQTYFSATIGTPNLKERDLKREILHRPHAMTFWLYNEGIEVDVSNCSLRDRELIAKIVLFISRLISNDEGREVIQNLMQDVDFCKEWV